MTDEQPKTPRILLGAFFLTLALAVVLRSITLEGTWANNRAGYNGACYWGQFAHNFSRFGFADSKGAPYLVRIDWQEQESGEAKTKIDYYVRHPFAISVLASFAIEMFGPEEWAIRSVPFLFMCGALIVAWPLGRRLIGGPEGALGFVAIMATLPMAVVYGQQLNSEGPILFFFLLSLGPYLRYRESGDRRSLRLALLAYFPALLFDWPAYLIGPLLCADAWFLARRREWAPLQLALVPVAMFVLFFGYAMVVLGTPNMAFGHVFRAAKSATGFGNFSSWLTAQVEFLREFYTTPILILAVLGGVWALINALRKRETPTLLLTTTLLGLGVAFAFFNRSIDHDYYSFYYVPAVALSTSFALYRLACFASANKRPAVFCALLALALIAPTARSLKIQNAWPTEEVEALLDDEWIREHTRPQDALLAVDGMFGYLMFYRDAVTITRLIQGKQLAIYRERLIARAGEDGKVTYLFPEPAPPRLAPIIALMDKTFAFEIVTLNASRFLQRGLETRKFRAYDLRRPRGP